MRISVDRDSRSNLRGHPESPGRHLGEQRPRRQGTLATAPVAAARRAAKRIPLPQRSSAGNEVGSGGMFPAVLAVAPHPAFPFPQSPPRLRLRAERLPDLGG